MNDQIIIENNRLQSFLSGNTLADRTRALLASQKEDWELLRNGYLCLNDVKVKTFDFIDFRVKVQFNPGRFTSTSAKVDKESVNQRKCFLCSENLPADQKGIVEDDFLILCNPYPIFHEHFTLPSIYHVPQSIKDSFPKLLDFGKALGKYYTVFYNGPKCGASAPDHLHFQAGEINFMPLDSEYNKIKTLLGSRIFSNDYLEVFAVDKYLRKFISFESKDKDVLVKAFELLYSILKGNSSSVEEEPMLNILVTYINDKWRVVVFPREKHRPASYFREGEDNILLSPGAVDMGGVLITPLEKDFEKLTMQDVISIFDEVSINQTDFNKVTEALAKKLKK